MTANMRPKIVIVVDPDIDVHDPVQVDWACAFRMQPARDMIVVVALPGGTLDPTVDRSLPLDRQTGSVVGIDATFPFGGDQDRGSPARPPRHLRPGAGREGARVHRARGCAGVAGV